MHVPPSCLPSTRLFFGEWGRSARLARVDGGWCGGRSCHPGVGVPPREACSFLPLTRCGRGRSRAGVPVPAAAPSGGGDGWRLRHPRLAGRRHGARAASAARLDPSRGEFGNALGPTARPDSLAPIAVVPRRRYCPVPAAWGLRGKAVLRSCRARRTLTVALFS